MDFCVNCKNYLYLKEMKIEDDRKLFFYCKKCDFKKECLNNKISFKIYRNTDITIENHLNKFKINDNTLPKKNCKCPKCKKTNLNPYETKYFNNSFNLNIICKNCCHNFFL